MNSLKHHPFARLICGALAWCLIFAALASTAEAQNVPRYDLRQTVEL